MLSSSFHSASRNHPYASVDIHLIPLGAHRFAAASRREDGEFEAEGADRTKLPQLADEVRHLAIRQRLVMPPGQPRAGRQQMIKMATPAGRIFPGSVPFRLRRIEYLLDPSAEAIGRLRHPQPQRLQHAKNMVGRDRIDR
jgi:hypothetical protein